MAVVLGLVAAACAGPRTPDSWERALAAAERSVSHDAVDCAERFRRLAETARTSEEGFEVAYGAARCDEAAGRRASALRRYDALAARAVDREIGARAAYRAALIVLDDDLESGRDRLRSVVTATPESVAALRALRVYVDTRPDGPDEARAVASELVALHDGAPATSLSDDLLWEAAGLHRAADGGVTDAERRWLRALVRAHPAAGHADDARWRLALLARERGDEPTERRWLSELAADAVSLPLLGTYHSVHTGPARLRLAALDEAGGDLDAAARRYRHVVEEHPESQHAAEALWRLAELEGRRGDRPARREALIELVAKFPESRLAGDARRALGDGGSAP